MSNLNKKKLKVFVMMSGGVDSSVAAFLLKKQGYKITGVFMKCFNVDGCSERDAEDARRVAEKLKIPFYVWDFEKEYKKKVVEYMVDGYRKGITPNPDVMCNREIKFGMFLERALKLGSDYVASGHYVRITTNDKRQTTDNKKIYKLLQAKDKNKDQSYFLWTLKQEQLKHCLFPIGDYLKPKVREIAKKAGLSTAEKKDSQGICFLGKVSMVDFLKKYIPEKKGAVLNEAGEKIGEHRGAQFYTIGQRHIKFKVESSKLKVENKKLKNQNQNKLPMYVAGKDIKTNTITMAEGEDNKLLYRKEVELVNVNIINQRLTTNYQRRQNGSFTIPVLARVRYRQPLAKATLIIADDKRISADDPRQSVLQSASIRVRFVKAQKFVASGQSVVFYNSKGEMLGGGIIV